MTHFIKSTDIVIQRYKLLFFYILNIWDILFTQFVVTQMPDVFVEINPIMSPIITTQYALLIKVFIPALVLLFWNYRYKTANDKEKRTANFVLVMLLTFYSIINIIHLINIIIFSTLS